MRNLLFATLSLCLYVTTAVAQSQPSLPAGADALEARLMTRVGPQTRGWIQQEAARQNAAGKVSELDVRKAITANPAFSGLPEGDINALTFLVMMESAKSAREDLKDIMSGVKQINEAKAALRQKAQDSRPAPKGLTQTTVKATPVVRQPTPISKAEFAQKLQKVRNDMDSLSEMGEMESLRLQMQMERMSKFEAALSNLMKKQSDTSQSMTQNLK